MTRTPPMRGERWFTPPRAFALASILLAFAAAVAWHIGLPGLYMDAVNPDFMVVDALRGTSRDAPMWYLPGNLLFGRIPVLSAIYFGTLNIWWDLPFVAVFGPSVAVLRVAQASVGAAILVMMFVLLRDSRPRWPWIAWLAGLALALDPVFVYAFRTQLYIQLCPVALLLGTLWFGASALDPAVDAAPATRHRRLFLAGLCFGLSIFGYFIFAFFAPALGIALMISCVRRKIALVSTLWRAGIGCVIGASGYLLGYLLVMKSQGGWHGFVAYFSQYQQSIGAFQTHRSVPDTLAYFASLIERVVTNDWQNSLMFGEALPQPGHVLKLALLLALPLLLWLLCEVRGRASWLLRVSVALAVSYPLVGLLFGDRLSGHHFVVLLPLAYLALASAAVALADDTRIGTIAKPSLLAVFVALLTLDAAGMYVTGTQLLRTHGRHLFSDAITHFADDANALPDPAKHFYVMPDWGLFTPFHYLTGARIGHAIAIDPPRLHDKLCTGTQVSLALIEGDIPARLRELTASLHAADPTQLPYRDFAGNTVFTLATYAAFDSQASQQAHCGVAIAMRPPAP